MIGRDAIAALRRDVESENKEALEMVEQDTKQKRLSNAYRHLEAIAKIMDNDVLDVGPLSEMLPGIRAHLRYAIIDLEHVKE